MKIAVSSQNRTEITGHTGRCRRFWIYEIENGAVHGKELLELTKEQSLHDTSPHAAHPLDHVQVLISGGMGTGVMRRLEARGVKALITRETAPDKAVDLFLEGLLTTEPPEPHEHGHKHRSEGT